MWRDLLKTRKYQHKFIQKEQFSLRKPEICDLCVFEVKMSAAPHLQWSVTKEEERAAGKQPALHASRLFCLHANSLSSQVNLYTL